MNPLEEQEPQMIDGSPKPNRTESLPPTEEEDRLFWEEMEGILHEMMGYSPDPIVAFLEGKEKEEYRLLMAKKFSSSPSRSLASTGRGTSQDIQEAARGVDTPSPAGENP